MASNLIYIRTQRPSIPMRALFIFLFILGAAMLSGSDGAWQLLLFGGLLCLIFGILILAHAKLYYDHLRNRLVSDWSIFVLKRTEYDQIPQVSYIAVVSVNVTTTVSSRVQSVSVTEGKFNVNLIHPKGSPVRFTPIATLEFKKAMALAKEIRKHTDKKIYMSAGPRKAWVD